MGKARSSRRMRNCKSRTKRGGGFCLNCSDEKKLFKKLKTNIPQLCGHVNGLTLDKQNSLYHELHKPEEKRWFIHCLVQSQVNTDGHSENIKEDITKYNKENEEQNRKKREEIENIRIEAEKYNKHLQSMPKRVEGHVLRATGSTTGPGGFFKPKQQTSYLDNNPHLSLYGKPVTNNTSDGAAPVIDPGVLTEGGGKSRRRHRRVRTLHKRRKSSKVRKTRYRRTHSRTRR